MSAASLAISPFALALLAAAAVGQQFQRGAPLPDTDCAPPALTAAIRARIAAFEQTLPPGPDTTVPDSYPYVPVCGNLWDDLHVYNFVDLDPTAGVLDYACSDWTYDTHRGHDVHIGSFAEMDIGVPVVAALPGVVTDAHDGEPDRNTNPNSLPSNYVILWHGGTHYSWYLHLRRNSVAVSIGQHVAGGQQLGLVGSSGNSSWPHLHFESWNDNAAYEPSSGQCRVGASNWTNQIARPTNVWVNDFVVGPGDFYNQQPLPNDFHRQGTWGLGWQYIGFWFQYQELPANATARVRFLRPDATVALDSGTGAFGNTAFERWNWVWYHWWVDCDQTGTWQIEMTLAGQVVATMPFEVAATLPGPTHAPEALAGATFEPAAPQPGDVLWCRLQQGLLRDRDYDLVSFHYVWSRNGTVVRDVTHAGKADCLRDDQLLPGAVMQCTITPTDGVLSGPSTTRTVVVGTGPALELSWRGAGHVDGSGKPIVLGPGPRDVSFAPDPGDFPIFAVSLGLCGTGTPFGQPGPCAIPAGVLLPDLSGPPLLTFTVPQLTLPAGTPWCYCIQAGELVAYPGGTFCVKFTNGYSLTVNY